MSTAEEPVVTPPANEEAPAQGTEPQADVNASEVKTEAAPSEPSDLMALLTAEFGEDPSGDVAAEEAAKALTADHIKNAPPELRVALRALLRRNKTEGEERVKAAEERMKAAEAREAAAAAAEKRAAQLRAASLRAQAATPDPGAPPKVDLLTEKGIEELLDYKAKKAAFEAAAPARAELNELGAVDHWTQLCEKFPLLKDPKVGAEGGEFDVFFTEFSTGFDLSTMTNDQRTALVTNAARLFTAEREAASTAERVRKDAAAKQRQQAESAKAIGRSSGSGGPDPMALVRQLEKQAAQTGNSKPLYDFLAANPKAREAYEASLS